MKKIIKLVYVCALPLALIFNTSFAMNNQGSSSSSQQSERVLVGEELTLVCDESMSDEENGVIYCPSDAANYAAVFRIGFGEEFQQYKTGIPFNRVHEFEVGGYTTITKDRLKNIVSLLCEIDRVYKAVLDTSAVQQNEPCASSSSSSASTIHKIQESHIKFLNAARLNLVNTPGAKKQMFDALKTKISSFKLERDELVHLLVFVNYLKIPELMPALKDLAASAIADTIDTFPLNERGMPDLEGYYGPSFSLL